MLGEIVAELRSRIPGGSLEVFAEIGRAATPQLIRYLLDRLVRGRQQALSLFDPSPGLVDTEGTSGKGDEIMRDVAP